MKAIRIPGSTLLFLRDFFCPVKTCFSAAKLMLSSDRKGKGVRRWGERLSNSPRCFGHPRPLYIPVLVFVRDYLWRRLNNFKLRAHLLDLDGLLFYHCRKTVNVAFQFRDPLLLFQRFIEHGLGLEMRFIFIGVDADRSSLLL